MAARLTRGTRRRQPNGHRRERIAIYPTSALVTRWRIQAAAEEITLPRWIVEQVEQRPPTMIRKALYFEVERIRTEISGAMANLNQVAKVAHTAGIDLTGWFQSVTAIANQLTLVEDLARQLKP